MTSRVFVADSDEKLADLFDQLKASGGGTIRLAPSDEPYTLVEWDRASAPVNDPITITSDDPEDRAVIRRLRLHNQDNVSVTGVDFAEGPRSGDGSRTDVISVLSSDGVSISDFAYVGSAEGILRGGDAEAAAMAMIRDSDDVTIEHGHAHGFGAGIAIWNSSDVVVRGIEATRWTGDGFFVLGSRDVVIEDNHFHDPFGADQGRTHSDFIQLTTTHATAEMERVTIRGNHFDVGSGPSYQGIFARHFFDVPWMREQDRPNAVRGLTEDGEQRFFHDVVIEDNVLRTANANVIAANGFMGTSVIRNNTALFAEGATHLRDGAEVAARPGLMRISVNHSDGVRVTGNIAEGFRVQGEGNVARGNQTISFADPTAASYAHDHLVNAHSPGPSDLRDITFRPGSHLNAHGSFQTRWSDTAETLTATATATRSARDLSVHTLDATLTRDVGGRAVDDGAAVTWTFEDGTVARGPTVTHDFVTPGAHRYALSVTTADGRTDTITRVVEVEAADLAAFDLAAPSLGPAGALRNHAGGEVRALVFAAELADVGLVLSGEANWDRDVGRKTSGMRLDGSADALSGADGFKLGVTLEPIDGASGQFVDSHRKMSAFVDAGGHVVFKLTLADGATARVRTDDPVFAPDHGARHVDLIFDGASDRIAIHVDGALAGSASVAGDLGAVRADVVIGNQFGAPIAAIVEHVALDLEGLDPAAIDATAAWERPDALVHLAFDGVVADALDPTTTVTANKMAFITGDDGTAFVFDDRTAVEVGRDAALSSDRGEFAFSFDLDAARDGRVLQVARAVHVSVTGDGDDLAFRLTTDEGTFGARTTGGALADEGAERVTIGYDDDLDVIQILVDGALAAEGHASGSTARGTSSGLVLGSKRGDGFEGRIDDFVMTDTFDPLTMA